MVIALLVGFIVCFLHLIIQFIAYYAKLCLLPLQALQVAFGVDGECDTSLNIRLASFVLDILCFQGLVQSAAFVICIGMAYGVLFVLKLLDHIVR